jgi:hypothetical protein
VWRIVSGSSRLYEVRVKARGRERAVQMANVTVEEARTLYFEQNSADVQAVRDSLTEENKRARAEVQTARDALTRFANNNNAISLTERLRRQIDLVASLRQQLDVLDSSEASSGIGRRGSDALRASLGTEQKELDRLLQLSPEYDRLASELQAAETRVNQLHQAEETLVVGQILPASARFKVLDGGRIQSQLFFQALVYSLGLLVGLLAGFTAVYILALTDKTGTAEQVAQAFDAPILIRIPRGQV